MNSRSIRTIGASLLSIFVLVAGEIRVEAYQTYCTPAQWKLHRYGQKAAIRILTPQRGPDTITNAMQTYAARKHLSYSSTGLYDPYKTPALKKLTHILQDTEVAIAITVETTNRDAVASASTSTFSFSCGPTKDWKPYWRDFSAFVAAKKYPKLSK
jgi:hypothetical protein